MRSVSGLRGEHHGPRRLGIWRLGIVGDPSALDLSEGSRASLGVSRKGGLSAPVRKFNDLTEPFG